MNLESKVFALLKSSLESKVFALLQEVTETYIYIKEGAQLILNIFDFNFLYFEIFVFRYFDFRFHRIRYFCNASPRSAPQSSSYS